MLRKISILGSLSFVSLALVSLPVYSQTNQAGTQSVYIQGDNNEVNQIINQYYFNNPGKGAIRRREPANKLNNNARNSPNRQWGNNRGVGRQGKK